MYPMSYFRLRFVKHLFSDKLLGKEVPTEVGDVSFILL